MNCKASTLTIKPSCHCNIVAGPASNFSLQYQYFIKHTVRENKGIDHQRKTVWMFIKILPISTIKRDLLKQRTVNFKDKLVKSRRFDVVTTKELITQEWAPAQDKMSGPSAYGKNFVGGAEHNLPE